MKCAPREAWIVPRVCLDCVEKCACPANTILTVEGKRRPLRVVCHERSRSKRLRAAVREMKEGPSGFGNQVLIPSHCKLLRSRAVVVSVAAKSGQKPRRQGRERR